MGTAAPGPRPDLDSWAVAIHDGETTAAVKGSGVVIGIDKILTCAHVVRPTWEKNDEIWVAFPKSDDLMDQRIRVTNVLLPKAGEYSKRDVAVLTLAESVPADLVARLRCPESKYLIGNSWWSFGFPDGESLGNSSSGDVGESLGYGWMRLDTESRYPVKHGYSGAGMWSPQYEAVVGLVGQASDNGDARAISLWAADKWLPEAKIRALADWNIEAAGETALAAWGWSLDRDPEAGRHWKPRARGVTIDSERGFRFRGRTAALTEIVQWMGRHGERRVLIVTGSPGVGKSSVLGRVVTTADSRIAAALPANDKAIRAPIGSIACAVHAKSKTAMDVAIELAKAASAPIPESIEDFLPAMRSSLMERAVGPAGVRPEFKIVIDALDEASSADQARTMTTRIILPLAETCADLGVKVLVGSRRRVEGGDLLAVFGPAALVVDLDTPEYFSQTDLAEYALATLQLEGDERAGNPYADENIARPLADRIAALADRNFLVAGLVARTHGLHDTSAVSCSDISFTPTVKDALEAYLQALPPVEQVSAQKLLTALAYAQAPGFTAAIWSIAVHAFTGVPIQEKSLQAFARSSAANFLIETNAIEKGGTFRLFHQALNDVLVGSSIDSSVRGEEERILARAFIAEGRSSGWENASPYLCRSLSVHAAQGEVLDELLNDEQYLLYADLRPLIPLAERSADDSARERARLLRKTPRAITATPLLRAALFSVTEVQNGLRKDFTALPMSIPYRALWSTSTPSAEQAVLDGHTGRIDCLSVVRTSSRELLASAGEDATIWIWDPATGEEVRILRGHDSPITFLHELPHAPNSALVSVSQEGAVKVWDPVNGVMLQEFEFGFPALFSAHVFSTAPLLAVSSKNDRTITLWDPLKGRQEGALRGHKRSANILCPIPAGERSLLASASTSPNDTNIYVWDPMREQRLAVIVGHPKAITALISFNFMGSAALATACLDGKVRIWDPFTGELVHTLATGGEILCLRSAEWGGQEGVIASIDGTGIWAWEPVSGRKYQLPGPQVGSLLLPVNRGTKTFAVSTGRGGSGGLSRGYSLSAWELESAAFMGNMSGHSNRVTAICSVRSGSTTLVASAGADRTVRIWDPLGWENSRGTPSSARPVSTLCLLKLGDSLAVAVPLAARNSVALLNAASGQRIKVLPVGQRWDNLVSVMSAVVDGRDVLVTLHNSGGIRVWDPQSENKLTEISETPGAIHLASTVEDRGRYMVAAATMHSGLHVWDVQTGRRERFVAGSWAGARAVDAVDIEGVARLVVGGKGSRILLMSLTGSANRQSLYGSIQGVNCVRSVNSMGSALLATAGDDGTVQLWDPANGEALDTLYGHTGPVRALSTASMQGNPVLVSAGDDRTIRIWDLASSKCLLQIPNQHSILSLQSNEEMVFAGLNSGLLAIRLS